MNVPSAPPRRAEQTKSSNRWPATTATTPNCFHFYSKWQWESWRIWLSSPASSLSQNELYPVDWMSRWLLLSTVETWEREVGNLWVTRRGGSISFCDFGKFSTYRWLSAGMKSKIPSPTQTPLHAMVLVHESKLSTTQTEFAPLRLWRKSVKKKKKNRKYLSF